MTDKPQIAAALLEYGTQASGCSVMTCGPHTGHFFQSVAFCVDDSVATVLAEATALLRVLEEVLEYEGELNNHGFDDKDTPYYKARAIIAKVRNTPRPSCGGVVMPRRCKDERAAVVAYLREGGTRTPNGVWYAWDSEMRSYAKGFADDIEGGRHLKAAS